MQGEEMPAAMWAPPGGRHRDEGRPRVQVRGARLQAGRAHPQRRERRPHARRREEIRGANKRTRTTIVSSEPTGGSTARSLCRRTSTCRRSRRLSSTAFSTSSSPSGKRRSRRRSPSGPARPSPSGPAAKWPEGSPVRAPAPGRSDENRAVRQRAARRFSGLPARSSLVSPALHARDAPRGLVLRRGPREDLVMRRARSDALAGEPIGAVALFEGKRFPASAVALERCS